MAGKLILTRHGESEFNAKSLWTGIWDIPLTDKGRHQAEQMAEAIADTQPDVAFESALVRATENTQGHLAHQPLGHPGAPGAPAQRT